MSRLQYAHSFAPLAALLLLCLLQAYAHRLRRVIAAFYFPKVSSDPPPPFTPLLGRGLRLTPPKIC